MRNSLYQCGRGGWREIWRWLTTLSLFFLAGCQTVSYYSQATKGQMGLLIKRQSISRLIDNKKTEESLRERLQKVERIREFAATSLGLPVKKQYVDYVALGRDFPVWSVVAAPELSLQPKIWCYPIVGCLSYRGFFREEAANRYAKKLEGKGYEVAVSGIPAYSTLGWFRDPVLSSFLSWSEIDLAELIFHELTHQMLYVSGDTTFNESLAVAVADEGVRRYSEKYPQNLLAKQQQKERQKEFVQLVMAFQAPLKAVFASTDTDTVKRGEKAKIYANLRAAYEIKKQAWGGYSGYDRWFATVNNAKLGSMATYHELVPAFQALLARHQGNLTDFMTECRRLAKYDKTTRHQQLWALLPPLSAPVMTSSNE